MERGFLFIKGVFRRMKNILQRDLFNIFVYLSMIILGIAFWYSIILRIVELW